MRQLLSIHYGRIKSYLQNYYQDLGHKRPFLEDCCVGKSKVIVNSFPKSGTHLLGKLVQLAGFIELPIMILDNQYLDFKDKGDWHLWDPVVKARIDIQNPSRKKESFSKSLSRILDGQFTTAHVRHCNRNILALKKHKTKHLFIYRDIRDVICSVADYRMSLKAHGYLPEWYYYLNALSSDEDRLLTVMEGKDRFLESYSKHLEYGWGWLNDPSVLKVCFEDLVGSSGGGNDAIQIETIRSVLKYLEIPFNDANLKAIASKLWGGDSRTMNRGMIGAWRSRFTSRVQDVFEERYEGSLLALGYVPKKID